MTKSEQRMTLAQLAYYCQRFEVCYWARQEAIEQDREYSDSLYRNFYRYR